MMAAPEQRAVPGWFVELVYIPLAKAALILERDAAVLPAPSPEELEALADEVRSRFEKADG